MYRDHLLAAQADLERSEDANDDGGASALVAALDTVRGAIGERATILDLGCGLGKCTKALLDRGYDAYGVDINEYWGGDRQLYWESTQAEVPPELSERLRVATLEPYSLPFPDAMFDHVISSQVLEHVDDLDALFVEIARTLKPGGTSIHMFPGRWMPPVECHIEVPLPVLCHSRAYLKSMAVLGFRSSRQKGLGWKEVYRSNLELMEITHYPRRREVLAKARGAGLDARFVADPLNARRPMARAHALLKGAGTGALADKCVMMLQQPRLFLSRPPNAGR